MTVLFTLSHLKLQKDSKECDFIGMLYFFIILRLSLMLYITFSKYSCVICIH